MNLKTHKNRGFTLLEIMLVVMIIALLAGSAIYFMGKHISAIAKDVRVKADIQAIDHAIEALPGDEWLFPHDRARSCRHWSPPGQRSQADSVASTDGQVPLDPWQIPYIYEFPGKHNPDSFDLYSSGSNRKPGNG